MIPVGPIYVDHLFPSLGDRLIGLLRGLSDEEWNRPTVCSLWSVKDIVAHLLDGNLRRLSSTRDHYFGEAPENIGSYGDLVAYLNRLNADWVHAARRLSPRVLTDLLEVALRDVHTLFASLDPHATAVFPVAWAGEERSENWFDIARDYTEQWLHQAQIRLALGRPGIMDRELYHPVIDAFIRALPHTYRDVEAGEGTLLAFRVTGDAGGTWFLLRQGERWHLGCDAQGVPAADVSIPEDVAWRLWTKGIGTEDARRSINVAGDERLGWKILTMLSVMA